MDTDRSDAMNDGFVQLMYEAWQENPESVSPEWRAKFGDGPTPAPAAAPAGGAQATAAPAAQAATQAPPAAAGVAPSPKKQAAAEAPEGAELMKGPAGGLVRNMNESLTVPTATSIRTIAVSTLDARRKALNAALAGQGRKLSFTHLVAWAIVEAWRQVPVMGHVFQDVGGKPYRIPHEHVAFGLAVDVEKPDGTRGLMVPCIREADTMDARGFFDAYDALVEKSRTGKLGIDEMMGTTLTLTNPGGIGTIASVPRLMKGQGTIVATGSIAYPVEFQHLAPEQLQQLGVSKVMTMTSTYDHRVIQGAESGRFLQLVDRFLQGEDGFYDTVAEAFGMAGDPATAAAESPAAAAPSSATEAPPAPAAAADQVAAANGTGDASSIMLEAGAGGSTPVHPDLLPEPADYPKMTAAKIEADEEQLASVAAAMALVKAHRTHGHLAAHLDPLGATPVGDPSLEPGTVGLTDEIMQTIPAKVLRIGVEGETFDHALPRLREKYCGTIAYEFEHISDHDQRVWLRRQVESGEHRRPLTRDMQLRLLERLTEVEAFERFVRRAYLAQKQFSIEGLDMMVPMLEQCVEMAADTGADEVLLGMAHRGRLNVLTHVLRRPHDEVLRYFEAESRVVEGTEVSGGGTGDVKYHMGHSTTVATDNGDVEVTLMPNPSHLEVVNPVVEGRTRAAQTLRGEGGQADHDPTAAVPVLIHGDAAFAGQGVVAETLNLQALDGYATGGTIHIIANNQVGFTTEPSDGRSTRYASDMAKGFDVPIIHVNADDAEGCLAAMKLAMAYRRRFHQDVMIDLIGYRRHGHNETDEPAYTQPEMYSKIKEHPRVRELFAKRIVTAGVIDDEQVEAMYAAQYQHLSKLHDDEVLSLGDRDPSELDAPTGDIIDLGTSEEPDTALDEGHLRSLVDELLQVPETFTVHPKLERQLAKRREMPENGFDWGAAEALAYGSLLKDGVDIRLTGQDAERGTFAHRHMVLNDAETGERWAPIQHLPGSDGSIEIHNSPLSELACLGYEYGYSIARREALVVWEAQFGDFVNGAQIVSDQFITSGMVKWGLTSRLTLLLPHGYEGNGPEHSNARLARWLASAAEGNIRVAQPTTAAQHFHLLRRQALVPARRPLVVMTPKGLLRAPFATSPISAMTSGRFEWVIDDPAMEAEGADRSKVTRLVLCSGKFYYEMAQHSAREQATDTAVARLELLYPFPRKQVADLLALYPNLREVVWAQEEPLNYGAFPHLHLRIPALLGEGVEWSYAGRPKRSSPSEGYTSVHLVEQDRIVREALGVGR